MTAHVVILGAGFGGLELSSRLAEELTDEVDVTLIDKRDSFVFGFSKLEVMFGRQPLDDVRVHYRDIAKPNVTFRQETVLSIDGDTRRVVTSGGTYDADILVLALGADVDRALTPGFAEIGHEFYSREGAADLWPVIDAFDRGRVVIAMLGPFFKCPPAPYEAAFLLHDHLVRRGVREAVSIELHTPLPAPIPVSAETSAAIVDLLRARDIAFHPQSRVTRIDDGVAHLEGGGTTPFDLFFGIPVHHAPKVVVESGLTEDDGWVAVDHRTFATRFADVYAVGDITSAPVPRAGIIAEGEAGTVADVLVARFRTGDAPPYDGRARCYLEMGDGLVGAVDVSFLGPEGPSARFAAPSTDHAAEKLEFGASRRRRWFGSA